VLDLRLLRLHLEELLVEPKRSKKLLHAV